MGMKKVGVTTQIDGDREFRKALEAINSDMRVLKSEMKNTSAAYDGNANSLDALTKTHHILEKQVEESKKKVDIIREAYERNRKELGDNDEAVKTWQTRLNYAEADLSQLNSKLEKNDKYMEEAKTSTNKTASSVDEFGRKVKETEAKTSTFGDVLKANLTSQAIIGGVQALAGAIKNVGTSAVDSVKNSAAYADDILTMSTQTGIAADTLQELKYMQELTDVSLETVTKSMAKNIKSMSSAQGGSKDLAEAYKLLGVNVTDSSGKLRKSETVFWESIDAIGKMSNETEANATAMKLFGKSAQDLNPLIAIGSDGIKKFSQEARDMGAVLNTKTLDSLGKTDDQFQRINQRVEIMKRDFGVELAPAVTRAAGRIMDKVEDMGDEFEDVAEGAIGEFTDGLLWLMDHSDGVVSSLVGIGSGLVALKAGNAAADAISRISQASKDATSLFSGLTSVLTANPVMIAAVAIGGIAAGIAMIAQNSKDAESETYLLVGRMEEMLDKSDQLLQKIKESKRERDESADSIEMEIDVTKRLADRMFDLNENTTLTNGQKEIMRTLAGQLKEKLPELSVEIDKETGHISAQKDEVSRLIEKLKESYKVKAAQSDMIKISEDMYKAEKNIRDLESERVEVKELLKQKQKEYDELVQNSPTYNNRVKSTMFPAQRKELDELRESLDKNKESIDKTKESMKQLANDYQYAEIYISEHSKVDATTESFRSLSRSAEGASSQISSLSSYAQRDVNQMYVDIKKTSDKHVTMFPSIGENMMLGIAKGMDNSYKRVVATQDTLAGDLYKRFNAKMQIKSPSRLYELSGGYMAEGVGVGWKKKIKDVNEMMGNSVRTNVVNRDMMATPSGIGVGLERAKDTAASIVLNIYPKTLNEADLDMTFNYMNRRFGMGV